MTDANRGGSGRYIAQVDHRLRNINRPQLAIDRALAQTAYAKQAPCVRAAYANGDPRARVAGLVLRFIKDCCRQLNAANRTLTEKQRNSIIRCINKPEVVERIMRENIADDTPEVLRVLPLKPPTRRAVEE